MMNATLTPPQHSPRVNGDAGTSPKGRGDLNQEGKRLQEWIRQIESLPQAEARELLYKCLQSVLTLHHDGLARVLQFVKNAGAAGREINDAFFRDKLVSSLLLIHNLHPVPLETRLRGALDKVRPYMESHGGNVELLQLENDTATLRLEGTCKSCPSSGATLELAVRQAVEEACPDLVGFDVEGVVAQSTTTDHTPATEPKWISIDNLGHLNDGEMRPREVAAVQVLFVKAGGRLYAYRNICPGCEGNLNDGFLEDKMLCCRLGHRFDVQRAGLCPDNPEIHLEPFPLLAANGVVKLSVR
jgi:Fe-S cluster biogenesis protein NfuA/nitrite reductase/ring-hydroxylating ferredoxin subunit